jgi:Zn-dependent peptidase ImmA (M78 family)
VQSISQFLQLPQINFPDFGDYFSGEMPRHPSSISLDDVEALALKTRQFWKLGDGSISNVVWLLENNGAIVTRGELYSESLDAFSEWAQWQESHERPYIFLGADKDVCARSRYDAAHELGHVILHRNIDRTCLNKKAEFKLIEDQADRFAGAFLLPASAFANAFSVPSLDAFRVLKSTWKVSVAMMIHRSVDLGFISKDYSSRLWANLARRGWKVKEPLDDEIPVERPRLLRRSFELLINEGVRTRAEITSALSYPAKDIEELAGLPASFLEEKQAPISLREFSEARPAWHRDEPTSPGEVVEFRPSKDRLNKDAQDKDSKRA